MLKAISFDFWNTLYDLQGEKDVSSVRVERLQRHIKTWGHEASRGELMAMMQKTWTYASQVQREQGIDIGPRGQLSKLLQELGLMPTPAQREALQEDWDTVLLESPPVIKEGARETLAYMAGKYKVALICNTGASPGRVLRTFMTLDGIIGYFDVLIFSDEVNDAKPGAKIFERMLREVGVAANEAAHIGDDPVTDVGGSHAAGLTAIWLAPSQWVAPEGCDQRVSTLRELMELY
ncbi:MAG: HAD family hydrolase [Syntrophomonadaceae bacterium]|nr:HAD family hydrolase [Syntrophomonadaceae bacterium]